MRVFETYIWTKFVVFSVRIETNGRGRNTVLNRCRTVFDEAHVSRFEASDQTLKTRLTRYLLCDVIRSLWTVERNRNNTPYTYEQSNKIIDQSEIVDWPGRFSLITRRRRPFCRLSPCQSVFFNICLEKPPKLSRVHTRGSLPPHHNLENERPKPDKLWKHLL